MDAAVLPIHGSMTPHLASVDAPGQLCCLACGVTLTPVLQHAASLRCHDCRDTRAPLRRELVDARRLLAA